METFSPARGLHRHGRHDRSRIDSAAEKRAYGHIGHQSCADRVVERLAQIAASRAFIQAGLRCFSRTRQSRIASLLDAPIAVAAQPAACSELSDRLVRTPRIRNEVQQEIELQPD